MLKKRLTVGSTTFLNGADIRGLPAPNRVKVGFGLMSISRADTHVVHAFVLLAEYFLAIFLFVQATLLQRARFNAANEAVGDRKLVITASVICVCASELALAKFTIINRRSDHICNRIDQAAGFGLACAGGKIECNTAVFSVAIRGTGFLITAVGLF